MFTEGLRHEHSRGARWFTWWFMVRRLAMVLVVVVFSRQQMVIALVEIQLIWIIYIVGVKPYQIEII